MNTTTTLRPLSQIAREILSDRSLKGNARAYAEGYLIALTYVSVRTDHYYADSAESCVLYALSNLSTWRGDSARRLKAELKAHLSE